VLLLVALTLQVLVLLLLVMSPLNRLPGLLPC
jgi:hypothetical protein